MRRLQQIGGAAGVVFAVAVAAELGLFLLIIPALGASLSDLNDPAKYAKLLAHGQAFFVIEGSFFALASAFAFALVRALGERSRTDSPELSASGAIFGYAGFTLLMLTFTIRVSLALDSQHAEQAIPSLTILGAALGAAGGVLLGVWVAFQSWSALRSQVLPRPLGYFGFLVAIALLVGGLTPAPVFIPLLLLWSLWVGLVLLREPEGARAGAAQQPPAPAHAPTRGA